MITFCAIWSTLSFPLVSFLEMLPVPVWAFLFSWTYNFFLLLLPAWLVAMCLPMCVSPFSACLSLNMWAYDFNFRAELLVWNFHILSLLTVHLCLVCLLLVGPFVCPIRVLFLSLGLVPPSLSTKASLSLVFGLEQSSS